MLGVWQRRRSINRAEVGRDRPALFPRDILQTVDLRHNPELHLGLGKHRLDGLGEPLQAIDTRDKAVGHPTMVQLGEDGEPDFWVVSLNCRDELG